ncbi:M14 family metallopeptidase [Sulfuriroseicoccus oceanibius]|uniref:M14 family metallocarboxypeptidase n=1 Tax=Sulfuriroseicoccus oceanibius TaxID=2707525 RepID=A0A6B3L8G6_9BACT|nr:M14 family metallocarboxypeptidase [Sulfuriroseicoccus oceanibius]QQL44980.1 M14 family metallocarboxypeptidase [Sulfuriroseicoccus oceanibius]
MDVHELIRSFDDEFSRIGAKREQYGDVCGYPLVAYRLGDGARRGYVSAGMHGDEPAGPLALLELLREGFFKPTGISWVICPVLNPTGLALAQRENHQGEDLNRDYLSRRTDEVAGHARWLDGASYDFALSLHEDWESTGFYYYEINQGEDCPERYALISAAVGEVMQMEPEQVIDDHNVRKPGWIYHECEPDEPERWPEAIFLAKIGCPLSFTFETPSSAPLELRVQAHKAAMRSALAVCLP